MDILGLTYTDCLEMMEKLYGKGSFHALGLWKYLHTRGTLKGLEASDPFLDNPSLARRLQQDFPLNIPRKKSFQTVEGTGKIALEMSDGAIVESVVIPMHHYNTLCISSQVGCARNCSFCRTAKMGLVRNLSAAEIVSQFFYSRFILKQDIRNIVFMGMGEPLDNLEQVLKAVDILTDPRGANLLKRRISISTCGQGRGLEEFGTILRDHPEKEYHLMPLSISLNAVTNALRDKLMPVNRQWPLEKLKELLLGLPQSQRKNKLYLEYIVIPEINDSREDVEGLEQFLQGLTARVNLIPLNAPEGSPYQSADAEDMQRFWYWLREKNITCYSRKRKGDSIFAACGQLAGERD